MKKIKNYFIVLASAGMILVGCKNANGSKTGTFKIASTVTQVEKSQMINVTWDTGKRSDLKQIDIVVKHGKTVDKAISLRSVNDLARKNINIESYYGKHTVEVTAVCGKETSKTVTSKVSLSADEYVIAPLLATVPVSIFTLNMREFTNDYSIPTFFTLHRQKAWNYDHLLPNVYPIPNASFEEITVQNAISRNKMHKLVASWMKELNEINPDSQFHIYMNDRWVEGALQATLQNGIGFDKFDLTLLSDGTGSYADFNELYDNSSAAANVAAKDAEWAAIKAEFEEKGTITQVGGGKGREYIYSMLRDSAINVKWFVNRIDPMCTNKGTIPAVQEIYSNLETLDSAGRIVRFNLGTYYNNLSEEDKNAIMKLYDLGTDVFAAAEAEGKKIMIILGTHVASEVNFKDYLNMVLHQYGDEYAYFYKGHPKYALSDQPAEMIEYFTSHGIQFLEPSIPAEFFYYFYPTVHYCGYESSTFLNVGDNPSDCVFKRYEVESSQYQEALEVFFSPLTAEEETVYAPLAVSGNYLIQETEFYNTTESRFDKVKVYNSVSKAYTSYVWNAGAYVIE